MRHLTCTATRAACTPLLLLCLSACTPGSDPAKACASSATLGGLKSVLLSAAAKGVEGAVGKNWSSLPGVQLVLDLPRLGGFDKTTKKATCEGRLITTFSRLASTSPQRTSEDITYTVQPSARQGEVVYEVAAAPITIAAPHTALAAPTQTTEQLGLAAVSADVGTPDQPLVVRDDVFDITAHPTVYKAYLASLPPDLRKQDWARNFKGKGAGFDEMAGEWRTVTVAGQSMLFGSMPLPHLAASDGVAVLLPLDQRHVYGARIGDDQGWTHKPDGGTDTPTVQLFSGTPASLSECLAVLYAGESDEEAEGHACEGVRL